MYKPMWVGMALVVFALMSSACGGKTSLDVPIPLPPPSPIPYSGTAVSAAYPESEISATVVLALFSTSDESEAEQRADAARELIQRLDVNNADSERMLDLLNTIAPGASISDRIEAAEKLSALSVEDDLDREQQLEVAEEISRLITGNALNAKQRIDAANELARRMHNGELDGAGALELVNAIAPESSIKARAEALNALATEFNEGDWDDEKAMEFANELHILATGDELRVEERLDATVDLSAEVLKSANKIVDDGEIPLDDDEVDKSARVIKATLKSDIASVKNLVLDDTSETEESSEDSDDLIGFYYCELEDKGSGRVAFNDDSVPCFALGTAVGFDPNPSFHVVEDRYLDVFSRMSREMGRNLHTYRYAVAYTAKLNRGES